MSPTFSKVLLARLSKTGPSDDFTTWSEYPNDPMVVLNAVMGKLKSHTILVF